MHEQMLSDTGRRQKSNHQVDDKSHSTKVNEPQRCCVATYLDRCWRTYSERVASVTCAMISESITGNVLIGV